MPPDYPTRLVVGANRGIGLALVQHQLEESGVRTVIATHRRNSDISQLEPLQQRHGDRLKLHEIDVTDGDSTARFAETLGQQYDGIDLAIHAAGILHEGDLRPEKSLTQCQGGNLARLFEVNSIGPLMTAQAIIPHQPRSKPFVYAALSAMVGSIGDNRLGGWYGYRASKAALNQFMRTLAIECRISHPGAIIAAIHPGTTDTALSKPYQRNVDPDSLYAPNRTAERILTVLSKLNPEQSGRFHHWDGSQIPW